LEKNSIKQEQNFIEIIDEIKKAKFNSIRFKSWFVRKLKVLFLILYATILFYLIYRAHKDWETARTTVNLMLISLWFAGVVALSRIFDWVFHENTEGERKQKEKLEVERNKEIERKKEERELTERLLSEIKRNQDQLHPFWDCAYKVLDHHIETSSEDNFPNKINFNINVYSGFSGRFGLLDYGIKIKIDEYYQKLKIIDMDYLKLNIHESSSRNGQKINKGLPFSHLKVLDFNKMLGKHNNLSEILEFLRNAQKAYDLGEELIKDLKK
jgi:hypothetical protein